MTDVRLTAIHIHPVKSCRRVEVGQAAVVATGLEHDREWQVVDADGACVTQRNHSAMATIDTALDGDDVVLSVDGTGSARLSVGAGTATSVRSLLGTEVEGVDAGDEAADFVSTVLGEPCRLAAVTDASDRRAPRSLDVFDQPLTFVDLAPVLIANEASLRWLVERAQEPFGMERFRPNLIVDAGDPWVEDTWGDLSVGEASVTAHLPWPRCAVPQIDQDSGERRREPALALRQHRWCTEAPSLEGNQRKMMEGNGLFGMGCRIGPIGSVISVGDLVTVHSTREPVLAPPSR